MIQNVIFVLGAAAFSLIPIYMLFWPIFQLAISISLQRSGMIIEAEIIQLRWKIRRGLVYYVVYRFSLPTGDVVGEQLVNKSHYENLKTKSTVSVKYLPKHPKISKLAGDDKDNSVRNGAIALFGFWIILALLYFIGLIAIS